MTDSTTPPPPDEPKADETFTWTQPSPGSHGPADAAGTAPTSILESVREAVDDLAERAAPSVREFSARAAELAAIAADRAAPLVKRAGEVTADATGKLATRSRSWAADLRSSTGSTATAEKPIEPDPESTPDGGPTGPI
ncbi:MAG: hypothetical protein QOJ75_1958 [Chloroflexota bacterium]|nr:hypothetical protein [Chloroflexota bacterium]